MEKETFQIKDDNNKKGNDEKSEEIDLKSIFKFVLRKKYIFLAITGTSCLLGIINALNTDRIWRGVIQIVISNRNDNLLQKATPAFGAYSGLANILTEGSPNNIKTELEILKSPSVLMPVFNYVKEEKTKRGKDIKRWKFHDWKKNNLNGELSRGTSIVNFYYQDNNKKLILDVLNKVSKTYQGYSSIKRNKNLDNAITYLENQVAIYKEKSINSIRKAGEYAINNELLLEPGEEVVSSLESLRVEKKNYIRVINQKLDKLENGNLDDDEIIVLAKANLPNKDVINKINKIDEELLYLRNYLKETDPDIKFQLENRKRAVELLKNRFIGYLKTEKFISEAIEVSTKRPKETLLRYGELTNEAKNDSLNLNLLQNELRVISLEKAKEGKPWEIITSPTVFDIPVAPNRKKLAFFSLIFGLGASTTISLLIERFGSKIYSQNRLKEFINYPLLINIPSSFEYEILRNIDKLFEKIKSKEIKVLDNQIVNIISIGNIDKKVLDIISKRIKIKLNAREIYMKESLEKIENDSINFFISEYGKLKKEDLINLNNSLVMKDLSLYGIIMISI